MVTAFQFTELERQSKKWVASSLKDAISRAKQLNRSGTRVILNVLGEHETDGGAIDTNLGHYIQLAEAMDRNGIDGNISVKLTQLGLGISEAHCLDNLLEIGKATGRLITIDLEEKKYHSATFRTYFSFLNGHDSRIAIQTCTKDCLGRTKEVLAAGGSVRLCKGAYHENGYSGQKASENLVKCAEYVSEYRNSAVASHDSGLLEQLCNHNLEFQTLQGIGQEIEAQMLIRGKTVSRYIPFGPKWVDYCLRRIQNEKH